MGNQSKSGQLVLSKAGEVVGLLRLKNRRYSVISLEDHCAENSASIRPAEDQTGKDVVTTFQIGGRLFYVVALVSSTTLQEGGATCFCPADLLSKRELQIVALVAEGRPNKQIADQLHISEWTVSTYLRRIFAKLGVDSRAAMIYRCSDLLNVLKADPASIWKHSSDHGGMAYQGSNGVE